MFRRREFTLIELIVVIAVLGILASIVIPNISGMQEKAKVAQTVSNIRNIQTAVDMYFVENESYPCEVQPTEDNPQPVDYALLSIDYLREEPIGDYTYVVDSLGIVSVLEDLQIEKPTVQLTPHKIVSNVNFPEQIIYTSTVLSFDYVLEDEPNLVVLAEKWTVDGKEQDTAPNQTFSEGEHTVTLSLKYAPKTRTMEEYWTEETVYKFNVRVSSKVKTIATGGQHTLALTENGEVYAWGRNKCGQLGDGTTEHKSTPTLIPSLKNVKQIITGFYQSYALTENGEVYAWGENDYGQLGNGMSGGYILTPTLITSLSNVKQLKSGNFHVLALTESGQVYTWGLNSYGQLGDGTLVNKLSPTLIPSISGIKEIEAGGYHSLALTESGQVYAWGCNNSGQLGDDTYTKKTTPFRISSLPRIKQIVGGYSNTFALTETGQVYSWGLNNYGQLGVGTNANKTTPTLISLLSNIKQVAAGEYHTLALTENGQIYIWGSNNYGQLGNGIDIKTNKPALLPSLSNVKEVAANSNHSFALTENEELYSWGRNDIGQLGDGTTTDKNAPTLIPLP